MKRSTRKPSSFRPAPGRATRRSAIAPSNGHRPVLFGDAVAAAFDNAAYVTSDPELQVELAAAHLGRILGRLGDWPKTGLPLEA